MTTTELPGAEMSNMQAYKAKAEELDALARVGASQVGATTLQHVVEAARMAGDVTTAGLVHTQEGSPESDPESFRAFATVEFTKQAIFAVLGDPEVREQVYLAERAQRTWTGRLMARLGFGRVSGLGMHNG